MSTLSMIPAPLRIVPFDSVARWQKFLPKSSKGAAAKKSWPKKFVAEFRLNFTKKWQKRGRRKFSKEVPYF
jgi:hypothetical protein